ncbi:hypothetical protein K1T71_004544 [Dendrolimus kikuchii]|uniref:Uncharacterized protein n=1 Tax=Dendrolimus kikuchii TaxID=765133 RepID=A0ACC1D8N4_9NEOP|nr:hypothetical protein K1T71_004544 [Dendrolimus kikuchii]
MDKCRICLKYKRKMNSIFDECNNISYAQMIMYVSKLKNGTLHHSNKTKMMLYKLASPIKPAFITDVRLLRVSDTNKKYMSKKRPERVCPYCGKISKSLRQHILKHTGDKKYKCDICSKAYNAKALLKSHLMRHTAKKNFNCDQCFATFFDEFDLKSHKISHSTEKRFSCSICNKAFKRKSTLKRHSLVHNLSNRKINCGLCSMSFITKEGLKSHMLVHTEERHFCCEICSQPYKNKRDFVQHCFKKHGVALQRRPVSVLNEEVLIQEKALMREIMLRMQGVIQDDKPINPFEGPQANLAFQNVIKLLKSKQLSIDL